MEENRWSSQSSDLLRKIREFTRSIVEDLSKGQSPFVSIKRFRNYCTNSHGECTCSYEKSNGQEILTLQKENHVHRIDVLLRVLLIVQQLLQENRHGSKRDIFYMHPLAFSEQSVVDRAINDICILMQCSRHNLNVVPVGNGLVMGWLRFLEAGKKFDCINSPNTVRMGEDIYSWHHSLKSSRVYSLDCTGLQTQGRWMRGGGPHIKGPNPSSNDLYLIHLQAHPIPVLVEDVKDIVGVAQYILVVEKESVFQRLANDQFCKTNRCIVITGRGYPDVPTRRFLQLLTEKLRLPVYCLVDCDPYGFDILATYRFGSMQMAYDAKFLRVPNIHWLGAFPSDSERYNLPQRCLLPLTAEVFSDKRKTEAMLLRCYLHREVPNWRSELELMLQRGVKFEIEALSVHSLSFLSEVYLPSKIHGGIFI